jgi:endonuclease YncB( thermonuclease family)
MRTSVLGLVAVAALAFAAGALTEDGLNKLQKPPEPTLVASVAGRVAHVAVPPPVPAPAQPAAAPAPPLPKDPGADLPVVQVAQQAVHDVPADSALEAAPAVTFERRAAANDELAKPTSYRPAPSAPRALPKRSHSAHVASIQPLPIDGRAIAAYGASLSVDGQPIRLFGVVTPGPRDRCGNDGASCGDAERAAIAERLAGDPDVSCAMPPGQEGAPAYVCRDRAGIDLGRLLVVEGLALADTAQSYEYLTDQDGARRSRQGLWRYR